MLLMKPKQRAGSGPRVFRATALPRFEPPPRIHGLKCSSHESIRRAHYVDSDSLQVMAPDGNVPEAMKEVHAMRKSGRGIIAMKLVGNADLTDAEDREKAVQYAVNCGCVDAMVIGFKSPAEVDEAIERLNRALKTKSAKAAA